MTGRLTNHNVDVEWVWPKKGTLRLQEGLAGIYLFDHVKICDAFNFHVGFTL